MLEIERENVHVALWELRQNSIVIIACNRHCVSFHESNDSTEKDFSSATEKPTTYLPSKGNRRLIQAFLLGITDVGVDDPLKGQPMRLGLEFCSKILSLDGELTSDGILHVLDGRIEICGGE